MTVANFFRAGGTKAVGIAGQMKLPDWMRMVLEEDKPFEGPKVGNFEEGRNVYYNSFTGTEQEEAALLAWIRMARTHEQRQEIIDLVEKGSELEEYLLKKQEASVH